MLEPQEQQPQDVLAQEIQRLKDELQKLKEKDEKIIVIQKDTVKPIRKFSGSFDCVRDFISEVQAVFDSRKLSDSEKVDIIHSNLSKSVKDELKCCPPDSQKNAATILDTLLKTYGEKRGVSELLGQFYNVQQRDSETVRAYSHRLNNAFDCLTERQRSLETAPVQMTLLRDHFISHLKSTLLRKKLKERVFEKPSLTFYDVRDMALRWVDDEEGESASVTTNAATLQQDLLTQLKDLNQSLQRIEAKVSSLGERVQALETSGGPAQQQAQGFRSQKPFTKDGRPICLKCKEPGHYARSCSRPGNGGHR
jgi:uncharacterized protein YdcH (DUF465 family)